MVYIYGLLCPIDEVIRYIGKSIMPEKRFLAHLTGARTMAYDHHTARWIRKLAVDGLKPSLVILEELTADADWRIAERSWIEKAQIAGWPLTNSTAGGEGLDYINAEDAARYRANLKIAMDLYRKTPAGKAQLKRMQDAAHTPEVTKKRIESVKAAWADPEKGSRMSALLELGRSPEARAKVGLKTKKRWAENHEEVMAKIWTPESKEKHRAAKKAAWTDPETRERLMNRWTPEAKAKQADEIRSRQAKIQAAMTPEVRAKQAAKLKETWAKRKAAKLAEKALEIEHG